MRYRPNIYNFDKGQRFGIVIPGLLIGFNETILQSAELLAKNYLKKQIVVSITTWEEEENINWINKLHSIKKDYPNLIIKIHTESYTGAKFNHFIHKFYSKLGAKRVHNVQGNLFKLLAVSYIHHYAAINSDSDFSLVDSFSNWALILTKSINKCVTEEKLLEHCYTDFYSSPYYNTLISKQTAGKLDTPFDVLTVGVGSSDFLELDSLITSISTYRILMGLTEDRLLESLYYAFTTLFPSFEKIYKDRIDINTDFKLIMNTPGEGTLEGPFIFRKFYDYNIPHIPLVYDNRTLSKFISEHPHYRSPDFEIISGELKKNIRNKPTIFSMVNDNDRNQMILKSYE